MVTPAFPAITTPPDYHRILSPNISVSTDPAVPVPGGLLACQRDPLLTSLETVVVSISEAGPPPKPSKSSHNQPPIAQGPRAVVVLHDTVLFPEGGGQPSDTGFITTNPSDGQPVVFRVSQVAGSEVAPLHYVELLQGDFAGAAELLKPGAPVIVWLGIEDQERRYDHMSMHTSQHLLSAVLEKGFNLDTLSWAMRAFPQPGYVEIPRHLTREEIMTIQAQAQSLVLQGKRIHVEVRSNSDNQENTMQGAPLKAADINRVVVIDGVDTNPCCGTHLPSTNNLQLFLFPSTDSVARGASGSSARLFFIAGRRLMEHLSMSHDVLAKSASILSCGATQVPDRISQVIEDRKALDNHAADLEAQLADTIALDLVYELHEEKEKNPYVSTHLLHRIDDRNALKLLQGIVTSFQEHVMTENGGYTGHYLYVIVSTKTAQTATTTATIVVFGTDSAVVQSFGKALKDRLGVKGGGNGLRWSGKFMGVWKEDDHGSVVLRMFGRLKNEVVKRNSSTVIE